MTTKLLHDGTEVSSDTPTNMINGKRYLLTPEEIAAQAANEAAFALKLSKKIKDETRRVALEEKWPDAFALMDDLLERGIEAVKTERDAIKTANPKGE